MQNLVFSLTIKPDTTTIEVDGRKMLLSPGMSVTVEVKTGKRRILEYLFSPLAEYFVLSHAGAVTVVAIFAARRHFHRRSRPHI